MTADKDQPGYGPWIPQWGGDASSHPQQGHHDGPPPHWGRHGGQGDSGAPHRGPWGPPGQWDRRGPWSHGRDHQEAPRDANPEQRWEPRGHWGHRGPWTHGNRDQQETQSAGQWGEGPESRGREGCDRRWRCGRQQETDSHGPSWAGVALTGAGVYGLYKLFQGGRRQQ